MARRQAFAFLFLTWITAYPAMPRTPRHVQRARQTKVTEPAKRRAAGQPVATAQPAQRWLRGMSLRDKIAQLVIITSYGEAPSSRSQAYRDYVHAVRNLKAETRRSPGP